VHILQAEPLVYKVQVIRNSSFVYNVVYVTYIPRTAYLDVGQHIVQSPLN